MRAIIAHFIKYPVAVNVMILAFFLLGLIGMFSMQSSFFPLSDSKIVTVQVTYPGASPQEMEEGIVLKIEDNLRGMVGVDRFTSKSYENIGAITVEAEKGYPIDVLLADVKNAVDKVPSFPAEMEPPVVAKQENLSTAIEFALSGNAVSLRTLKSIGRQVESELRSIDGISQVTLTGFPDEEITVSLDEENMRARGITFQQVSNAIAKNNLLVTGGSIKTESEDYLIRVNERSYYANKLQYLIVGATNEGSITRLKDIAVVQDAWSETPERTFFNGDPSVEIKVQTTNNEDLVVASDLVKQYIERYNANSETIKLNVIRDPSIVIVQRTELLAENGLVGMILVVFFLSLFLRPRLAFWVAFGLPISFLGMFMFVNYLNVTINVLSLFGMIIVIGILVDDGIVIAENIYHHYEKGKNRIQAAIDGTMEVLPAIISAVLTTMVAFSTFFFLDGRIGEFFGEVTVIVILTLGVSLIEALIILPAHVAHSKALSSNQKTFFFNDWADKLLYALRDRLYLPFLRFSLKWKLPFVGFMGAILVVTGGAIGGGIIKTTFFPVVSSDRIEINLLMPQGVNESATDSLLQILEDATWEVNDIFTERQTGNIQVVQNVERKIGPGSAKGYLMANLLPGEDRDFATSEIAAVIAEKVGGFPQAESLTFDSGINFGGKPVSVSLLSFNIQELKAAKAELKNILKTNPLLKDINDNDPSGIKEVKLELNDKAYLLGFTLNDVISQVRSGFNGLQVQRFQRGQDEIIVWVRFDIEGRSSIKNLDDMRVVSSRGERVPLSEIADYTIERGDLTINHLDGKREIKVEADLKNPKESASDIIADIRANVMPDLIGKYPSITALYEGQNREATKVSGSASKVAPIILFIIYLIISFTFRSYTQPLLLLMMVPFSLIGVAWGHWAHDQPINVLSFLGIIALIGIVVNDGLVLISKLNTYLKEGKPFEDALYEAGKSRFRAIFLTSITTIAGLSPLILEESRQAQFLIPMAVSIAYGIGIATILTLVMLPVLLAVSNWIKVHVQWLWDGKKPSHEEVESAIKEIEAESYDV